MLHVAPGQSIAERFRDVPSLDCLSVELDSAHAMRALCRVLKPGGWAVIQLPIQKGSTKEDPSIVDPRERDRHFGQRDHVRHYGLDIVDRLKGAGFSVRVFRGLEIASPERCARLGFDPDEVVFLCA